MTSSVISQIICFGEKHNVDQLRDLVNKTSTKALIEALNLKLGKNDCAIFWNYLLQSFDLNNFESCEKRFACVKFFLDGILRIELSYKQTYDLITRLGQELQTFSLVQLVEIMEHCLDSMRAGDPKCVSWKDLIPECLKILSSSSEVNVNSIKMTGMEYRSSILKTLFTMRWPKEILTPLADMLKDMNLQSNELVIVLNKFSDALLSMTPQELPSLSFQLFSLCSTASEIFIPILALEKYFHRYYYKKLYADMCSNSTDFDSIDSFSDKELREAEETILHHFNYCVQYKLSEVQLCTILKNFSTLPDVILTPFVMSIILSVTPANRDPEARLSNSPLLHFLKSIIKNNEEERKLADYSVWCRDTLQKKQVNLDDIFTILINHNKDGKDVVTPGLVNLMFLLLKLKNSPQLNSIAIAFLTKFIRKRFVFAQGIVKKLCEWMIVEQEVNQFSECLTLLSVADTFTVSECVKTIKYVLEFLTWIPGSQGMRMMSFIFPILKISPTVRDMLIEVLRKAMSSSNVETRQMAVYGFCMILKQLSNSNSHRSQMSASSFFTQHSISGFSLMSQATLGSVNNPQRHFDMLTLDIIGLLRNCFTQHLIIKTTLYENLQRAVELNPKLVPHVLQFIDSHFRSYFKCENDNLTINFNDIVHVREEPDSPCEVTDNLGKLLLFVSHCLNIFDKYQTEYDVKDIKRYLEISCIKIISKEIKLDESVRPNSLQKREILIQHINFIEGILSYLLLTSKRENENVSKILPLFRIHQKLLENLKTSSNQKKGPKKGKGTDDFEATILNVNGGNIKKSSSLVDNIWDLVVVERFLRLLHEDIVPFAVPQNANILRSNTELVRYVLEIAAQKVEHMRFEPEYKQLVHSKRSLKYLTDITKIVYERCIYRLPELWKHFDVKSASAACVCFYQCLNSANTVYKKKFSDVFVKGFDFHIVNNSKDVISTLHDTIDKFMEYCESEDTDLLKNEDGKKIPEALLQCLEILYDNVSYSNRATTESYSWLLSFCKRYEIDQKELYLVHKLLFQQRQKTHSGAFFNMIAKHLGKVLGTIQDDEEEESLIFKSVTLGSAESCLQILFATLKKQIEQIEYFIGKANNSLYKIRLISEEDREMAIANLHSLERSICTQLVHISNTFLQLTNVCIPLGHLMDNLTRLLMQQYTCLKNLARHFLTCCNSLNFSIEGTKFDALLRVVGKPLSSNIYTLITYIEANILDNEKKKKSNAQAEKAKVLRETKFIPKLILCVENFNRQVILLGKKTNDRISNYLHFGTVRDFRIKTNDLKAAIERTLSHSSEIEPCDSDQENKDNGDDNKNDTEAELEEQEEINTLNPDEEEIEDINHVVDDEKDDSVSVTPESIEELKHESNKESATQLLKNLAKINTRAKKRSLKEVENNESEAKGPKAAPVETKKRRTRSSKK